MSTIECIGNKSGNLVS